MFNSKRFTTVPTKECRSRLEKALTNDSPIGRRERHRGAVTAIQSALADLNKDYLSTSDIDGYYGSKTYRAVEIFQRDYGLVADGSVGKQTISQLDMLYSSDVIRAPRGMSIHVGVDVLDQDHYGPVDPLTSCVNDARKMLEIAESLEYDAVIFEDENATAANFISFMQSAIHDLFDGDSLFITFSGHGSQIPNTSIDNEIDDRDETLCFYDRMLIDDELYGLLGQLKEGVRVHMVFDSCHSGTVAKAKSIVQLENEKTEYQKDLSAKIAGKEECIITNKLMDKEEDESCKVIAPDSLSKALDGDKPEYVADSKPEKDQSEDIITLFSDLFNAENSAKRKNILIFEGVYERNKEIYDTIQNVVGQREHQQLACSIVSLSACQDSQTTPMIVLLLSKVCSRKLYV